MRAVIGATENGAFNCLPKYSAANVRPCRASAEGDGQQGGIVEQVEQGVGGQPIADEPDLFREAGKSAEQW